MNTNTYPRIAIAIEELRDGGAVRSLGPDLWAYWSGEDPARRGWWTATAAELLELADRIETDPSAAYSLWCAEGNGTYIGPDEGQVVEAGLSALLELRNLDNHPLGPCASIAYEVSPDGRTTEVWDDHERATVPARDLLDYLATAEADITLADFWHWISTNELASDSTR